MRAFTDEEGANWSAEAWEEVTPRHHGRWYLVFRPGEGGTALPVSDIRWQNAQTAQRTIDTMSLFELRRRLGMVRRRAEADNGLPRIDHGQNANTG